MRYFCLILNCRKIYIDGGTKKRRELNEYIRKASRAKNARDKGYL